VKSLDDILSGAFSVMIPQTVLEPVEPDIGICSLKSAAVRYLVDQKKIINKFDIDKFNDINTIEQLEFYLLQYSLTDTELLNIYRSAFANENV
jgi:hypothetical protein